MANAGMAWTMCLLTNTPYLPKISTISTYICKGIPLSVYPLILTYSSVILFYEIRVFIHETENIAHEAKLIIPQNIAAEKDTYDRHSSTSKKLI